MARALISGATGVLGKAFCRAVARRGDDLFMTARSGQKLAALKAELEGEFPDISVDFCPCDLASDEEFARLFAAAEKYSFAYLYNVAGADIQQPFINYDDGQLRFQIRSTFEGAVRLISFAVSHRAKSLKVLNISSVSGILPMPYFAVYSSCKRALTDISLSLAKEFKGSGVKIQAAVLGSVYTRPDVVEYIKSEGAWARLSAKSPEWVVDRCLKLQNKKKCRYVLGFCNKFTCFFNKIIPLKVRLAFVARRWKRTTKNAFFKENKDEQS